MIPEYNNKIQSLLRPANITGILWHRISKHPVATLFSVVFAFALVWILCLIIGEIYPDFKSYYKKLPVYAGNHHCIKYNFYSGEGTGVYSAIGKAVTNIAIRKKNHHSDSGSLIETIGLFRDHDTLVNCPTGGGFDNFMKVSNKKNSFGLVQEAVINMQDEHLRKSILMETPLFMERLHIFYRKRLFQKIPSNEMQLSANTDPRILDRITNSVRNIQVGIVGSCTHIIACDVMELLKRQMAQNSGNERFIPRYKLIGSPLSTAIQYMQKCPQKFTNHQPDSVIDMMFLVGADPTQDIKNILDSGKYGMMSVHPSFMDLLNKEFKLNLQVADFHGKYDGEQEINTVGTLSFLIASGDVQIDDFKKMLRKIYHRTDSIHQSLITLPAGHSNECYSGTNDTCKYTLPLAELGFFKRVDDEDNASSLEETKAMIPFLIAMISFFIPVLKSVSRFKSLWWSWHYNKSIDQLLFTPKAAFEKDLRKLMVNITDLYGDCELSEAHFNALAKRIAIYLPEHKQDGYQRPLRRRQFSRRKLYSSQLPGADRE